MASTQEEIAIALECTLSCWKKHNPGTTLPSQVGNNASHHVASSLARQVIGHPKLMETLTDSERADCEILG